MPSANDVCEQTRPFLPLLDKLAWNVRRGHGSFLNLEFGRPHILVRDPVVASPGVSARVRRKLTSRRVTVVGDWSLGIHGDNWTLKTTEHSALSVEPAAAGPDSAMSELEGQILVSASPADRPNSCALQFDLGAVLTIWPAQGNERDQLTIEECQRQVTSYTAQGGVITTIIAPGPEREWKG